jgi:DNA-directed RNA polymerase subunit H (RpoH/RPB5)
VDTQNFLIPKHRKISQDEVNALLVKFSIQSTSKLPRIHKQDPALVELAPEIGDVIEIIRTSFAGKNNKYYRVVVE